MAHAIKDIAEALGCEAAGNVNLRVEDVAEPDSAGAQSLALATNPKYAEGLSRGQARAALLWEGADWQALGLEAAIFAPRPRMAMAGLTALIDKGPGYHGGIHPTAVIGEGVSLGENVSVGPHAIISDGVRIGDNTLIGPQCFIGTESEIGPDGLLHAGVKIGPRVQIGARFIAHFGAVIGGDGFSFVTPEENAVERARHSLSGEDAGAGQNWVRIHSLGAVIVGDDCEIGCNTTVDAGTVRATQIGHGTKIDNLSHIGHNVIVGNDCLMAAYAGVAGSSRIGNNVVFGGQVGVSDNLSIGDRAVITGGARLRSNVPEGRVMMGDPATRMDQQIELYKAYRRLPRLFRQVADLQKAVFKGGDND